MPINGYIDQVFALDGDKTPVPDAPQGDGTVSFNQGYTAPYQLNPSDPSALLIDRAQFNQILNYITTAIQYIQQHGAPPFITTVMNGGISPFSYQLGAIVSYDDGDGSQNWVSTAPDNETTPGAVDATWTPLTSSNSQVFVGSGVTTGTANAQALATTAGNFTNAEGSVVFFVPGFSNTLAATVAIDGQSALSIKKIGITGLQNLGVSDLVVNQAYLGTVNGGVLQLIGPVNPTQPVVGAVTNLLGSGAGAGTAAWTAQEIIVEDSNGNTKKLSAFSQGVNVATSGIGGHQGSLTNSNWYPVYASYNPATNTAGAYIDSTQNYSTPTPPSGFTQNALISSVFIDGSGNITKFTQAGKELQLGLPSQLATGGSGNSNTPVYTALTVRGNTSSLPPNAIKATIGIVSASNDGISVIVAPNGNYGAHGSLTNPPPLQQSNASNAGVLNSSPYGELILESNSINYAIGAGSGGSNQSINLYKFAIG